LALELELALALELCWEGNAVTRLLNARLALRLPIKTPVWRQINAFLGQPTGWT